MRPNFFGNLPFRPTANLCLLALLSFGTLANSRAQTTLTVEHDLKIPSSITPWAVDTFQNLPQLVPIHHSNIVLNKHTGGNIAGSLAGSFFYKPKISIELSGINSRTQLHSKNPLFYLRTDTDQDTEGDSKDADAFSFAIVRAEQTKDRRVVDKLAFTQLTGKAKRNGDFIEVNITKLPDGWIRIEPKAPMEEGEYAILPIPKTTIGTYASVVYDFGIDLKAPNEKDAIIATKP